MNSVAREAPELKSGICRQGSGDRHWPHLRSWSVDGGESRAWSGLAVSLFGGLRNKLPRDSSSCMVTSTATMGTEFLVGTTRSSARSRASGSRCGVYSAWSDQRAALSRGSSIQTFPRSSSSASTILSRATATPTRPALWLIRRAV